MEKEALKRIILEYQQMVADVDFVEREADISDALNYVLVGLRRAGKSYMLYRQIRHLMTSGHDLRQMLYFNFEDDRLEGLTLADLDLIKVCYEELFQMRPIFFLDEIQNVDGWEHYARRLADQKFRVYITGSNSRMLSMEIAGTLGGRYMIQPVYPYSFSEFLVANDVFIDDNWLSSPSRTTVVRLFDIYLRYGGLPELQPVEPRLKRPWLSNLYNKIFFGDIMTRYSVRHPMALRTLMRKLAECVCQPCSYTRLANVVSSTGIRTRVETIAAYIQYIEDSCMLFEVENYAAKISDKVSNKKYYFIDNGLLNLFLFDPNAALLENIVAIFLHAKYTDMYYYRDGVEVDFYLWEHATAIQVAWTIKDAATRRREIDALMTFARRHNVEKMIIITYDERETIEHNGRRIDVFPAWQWLLGNEQ